jgi:hypothetical protein
MAQLALCNPSVIAEPRRCSREGDGLRWLAINAGTCAECDKFPIYDHSDLRHMTDYSAISLGILDHIPVVVALSRGIMPLSPLH